MKKRAPRPLARSLAMNFALVGLIPLAAISLLVIVNQVNTTREEVGEKNMLLARSISVQVEEFIGKPRAVLKDIKGFLLTGSARGDHEIEAALDHHVSDHDVFESIYLLGPDGQLTHAGLPEGMRPFRGDYIGIDLSHKDFYRSARRSQKLIWSNTFLSLLSGRMVVALCLAVDDRVLVGNLDLDILSAFTGSINAGQGVTTMIVDRRGYIIVHSDPVQAARQVNIRHLSPVKNGLMGNAVTDRYSFEDEEFLGSVAIIPGPAWLALVSQNLEDAYGQIWRTGMIFFLGIVAAALMAVLVAMIIARRFSRPLSEFTHRAKVIAGGNYDFSLTKVDILEIMELATSFGRMTDALRDRENRLRESEVKYRLLVENANDAIFVVQDGTIKYANPRTEEMSGYPSEHLLENTFVSLVHPEDSDMVAEQFARRLGEEEAPSNNTFRFIHRDGGEIWALVNSILIDWEGRPATLNFARDITDQKSLELQARQAQKLEAIGTLAGGIAHDFNNLLQAIQGYAEVCLLKVAKGDQGHADLQGIIQAAQKGGELTRQLMLFGQKSEGQERLLDINEEIERTAKVLDRTLPKTIKIDMRLQQSVKWVNADPSQIDQVLMNLVVNARDAMPEGGTLTIETRNIYLVESGGGNAGPEPGEYVLLSVSDTGIGINAEIQERLFEPFFTTKEPGRGTGLGLAMVYGIVKNHHGYITCLNSPGGGATFKVYLPAVEAEPSGKAETPFYRPEGGVEKILIVDDEKPVRDFGEKILSAFGYTVMTAPGGEEAVEIYRREGETIDLVILDMIMPGMGGKECLKELISLDPGINILVSSGFSSGGTARDVADAGARGLIRKPYVASQLLRVVRATLDGRVN